MKNGFSQMGFVPVKSSAMSLVGKGEEGKRKRVLGSHLGFLTRFLALKMVLVFSSSTFFQFESPISRLNTYHSARSGEDDDDDEMGRRGERRREEEGD